MWARAVECMFACWLAVSPFVFHYQSQRPWLVLHDYVVASMILVFGFLSYWRPTRHAHLATAVVACWLMGFGRLYELRDVSPPLQNYIVVGILLLMFAVVPNYASQPPAVWQPKFGHDVDDG